MTFKKSLREGVRRGDVTCSVRIWKQPRVKVGGRYAMETGEIVIDEIRLLARDEITPTLARRSGFRDVPDLLETAQHGTGEHVFLVEFHYEAP